MSIEEQLAALEARIQACMISVAGATDQAEQAASRAEAAAARAALAALGCQQAEVASVVAAEISAVEAAVAVEAAQETAVIAEQIEEVVEDASDEIPDERGGVGERQTEEPERVLDGERASEESSQPIVLRIETRSQPEPTLFKPNRTRFRRGRTT